MRESYFTFKLIFFTCYASSASSWVLLVTKKKPRIICWILCIYFNTFSNLCNARLELSIEIEYNAFNCEEKWYCRCSIPTNNQAESLTIWLGLKFSVNVFMTSLDNDAIFKLTAILALYFSELEHHMVKKKKNLSMPCPLFLYNAL